MRKDLKIPLTVYGILARKWNTSEIYVGEVARGKRKALRGKGLSISRDLEILKTSLDDWCCKTLADKSLRIDMPRNVSIYVQQDIASVYMDNKLLEEKDVKCMTIPEFREWLNLLRMELN